MAANSAWKPIVGDVGGQAGALADLVDEIDLEALEVAVRVLVLPRRIGRIGADIQYLLRHGNCRRNRDAQRGKKHESRGE